MPKNKLAAFSDMFLCLQIKHYEKSENMEQLTNTTCSMSYIDSMEGHEFERFIAALLCRLGYQKVEVTRGSGDQGVDILAEKDDIRYAIQCKCYSSDLGNTPVQEVNAGKAIYHCHVGVVVTNRYFTKGAKDAAVATGVIFWDRVKLQTLIMQAASKSDLLSTQNGIILKGINWNEANSLFSQAINSDIKAVKAYETEQQQTLLALAEKRKLINQAKGLIAIGDYVNGQLILGVRTDGTVAVESDNSDPYQKAEISKIIFEIRNWEDIIAIATAPDCTVGLKSDGTIVVAKMGEQHDQQAISSWKDIIAIDVGSCGYHQSTHIVGLKSNGTVIATGSNNCGQCNVSKWADIVAVACGSRHTVGLKSDGTVIATGDNSDGQCNVNGWTNIVAVACGDDCTMGLNSNGTVVFLGGELYKNVIDEISNWHSIVGIYLTTVCCSPVGLKYDNTVVDCLFSIDWETDMGDIVAIATKDYNYVELKSSGLVTINSYWKCDVSDWELFDNFDTLKHEQAAARVLRKNKLEVEYRHQKEEAEIERRRLEQERKQKRASLETEQVALQSELANLKGLFTGKRRREIEARLVKINQILRDL